MGCSASKPIALLLTKNPEQQKPQPFSTSTAPTSTTCTNSASHSSNSSPAPPLPRTLSLPTPLVHHPPLRKGDTHHLVSLTSTTYGSLFIHPPSPNPHNLINAQDPPPDQPQTQKTSLSPDSVINTWELMDGLDDFDSHSHFPSRQHSISFISDPPNPIGFSNRYSSFDGSVKKRRHSLETVKSSEIQSEDSLPSSTTKPLWQHLSEESLLAKMDPNVVLTYRRALSARQLGYNYNHAKATRSLNYNTPLSSSFSNACFRLRGAEDKIVIYFTSLRGIRKTYEDCCAVRMIFRAFRVAVDERDISMDSEYRKELHNAVGGKAVSLPQVFVRGKYVGGAEEVKQLNEVGELAVLLSGFPEREAGFVCKGCGDARFAPCPNCSGSRKVFDVAEGESRRCSDCNENGLIRCPACCS